MAHLIDKDALVLEIEKRTDELWVLIPDGEKVISDKHTKEDAFNIGKYNALESLGNFLDTFEVKEVDLEKKLNGFQNFYAHENSGEFPSAIEIAKHFFELGLKAHKGE